jgi:hypothetical protein
MIAGLIKYIADRLKFIASIMILILVISNVQINIMDVFGKRIFTWMTKNKNINLKIYIYASNIEFFEDIKYAISRNFKNNKNVKLADATESDCIFYTNKPEEFSLSKQFESEATNQTKNPMYSKELYFQGYKLSDVLPNRFLEDNYTLKFKSSKGNVYFMKCKEETSLMQIKTAIDLTRR